MTEQPSTARRMSTEQALKLRVNLLRLAGLAALLGLLMEALAVVGGAPASLRALFDHGLWPFTVCVAVGLGQSLVGLWPARAGAFALVATPVAFLLAKVLQKGMSVLVDGAQPGALIEDNLWLEAGLRAVEYAVLAAALAWLVRQEWSGALAQNCSAFSSLARASTLSGEPGFRLSSENGRYRSVTFGFAVTSNW